MGLESLLNLTSLITLNDCVAQIKKLDMDSVYSIEESVGRTSKLVCE
jgi:hypothetical protein